MNFNFDGLIFEQEFCNFSDEKKQLEQYVKNGQKVKVYGPRNFGKTSLVKNIIGLNWQSLKKNKRFVVYVDLYSVSSLEDISEEINRAFQKEINDKKSILKKGVDFFKSFKYLRPTFSPANNGAEFGEFSLKFEIDHNEIYFEKVFNEINRIVNDTEFEFLIILDEFQEIGKIKKAEAKLRGSLQELNPGIPVIILGSKQHMLVDIFEKPKAPFYSWGNTIELTPIDFNTYTHYINERLYCNIDNETGKYLQMRLNRIPESINRFGDYLNKNKINGKISINEIDRKFDEFIFSSRSIYEEIYSKFSNIQKDVIRAIAASSNSEVKQPTSKEFLKRVPNVSKASVANVFFRFLDDSIISRSLNSDSEFIYKVTDPFLNHFLNKVKNS